MAPRVGNIARAPLVVLAAATLLSLLAASPSLPAAEAGACSRWGDTSPKRLSNGQARDAVLCLINRERQQRGLPAFDRNRRLQKAAQRHNEHMDGTGCFAHECPGEAGLDGRLRSVGYLGGAVSRWAYGENVAWGIKNRGTPSAVVEAWMGSLGHRSCILSTTFEEVGVGFSAGSPQGGNDPGGIYTTDFGLAIG